MKMLHCLVLLLSLQPLYAQPLNTEPASTHGMVLLGTEKIYASHLPMFHVPHNYQAIFEITLDDNALNTFHNDQQAHPNELTYTIEPEPFVLSEMLEHPTPFNARLYRGHFERGGILIDASAQIVIKQIIYSKKITNRTLKSTTDYLLFGDQQEQFAIHLIKSKPSFDHIVQISTPVNNFSSPQIVTIHSTQDKVPDIGGNTIEAKSGNNKVIEMHWQKQIYLEFSDLQ